MSSLDLGDNQLSELPAEIGLLTNLRVLHLNGNRLSEEFREFTELVITVKRPTLTEWVLYCKIPETYYHSSQNSYFDDYVPSLRPAPLEASLLLPS